MTAGAPPERPRRHAPIAGVIYRRCRRGARVRVARALAVGSGPHEGGAVRDQDPVPIAEVVAPSDASDAASDER